MLTAKNIKIVCIVLAFVFPWVATVKTEADVIREPYSDLATSIIGSPVDVHCGNYGTTDLGFTYAYVDGDGNQFFSPDIYLATDQCAGLYRLLHYRPAKFNEWFVETYRFMGEAAITLVHEAMHIYLNSTNEAIVECYAYRHVRGFLVQELDMPRWEVNMVMMGARESHYATPDEYRTVC